jgi:hypothetical protein
MTRPTYETASDRAKEEEIAKTLASIWLCSVLKMKPACVIDYAIKRSGLIVAVMEIKCRSYTSHELDGMGGLILSAHKMQNAKQWRDTHKVAFVLALGLPDGIFAMAITADEEWPHFQLVMAGRRDRGDAQDIEPCVLIPMKRFAKYA